MNIINIIIMIHCSTAEDDRQGDHQYRYVGSEIKLSHYAYALTNSYQPS